MSGEDSADVYDRIADGYAATNPQNPAREGYEWPAVRALLPDLEGLRVLDAGCGSGYYTNQLANAGADVLGVDASESMIRNARERYGDAAEFEVRDLRESLSALGSGSFDLVVSQLTLEHIKDWDHVFTEFADLLSEGGCVVASTAHPFTTYFVIDHEPPDVGTATAESADYYAIEEYEAVWEGADDAVSIPFYRRSLQAMLDPLFEAGFVLDGLREPTPTVESKHLVYFSDNTPRFVTFRARKSTESSGQ